jgi:hypothetical protein
MTNSGCSSGAENSLKNNLKDDSYDEFAEYLAEVVRESGYKPQDYYLFCATGDLDIAYPNLNPQVEEMKKLTDCFIYSSDLKKGNFYFIVCDGGTHAWNWVNQYIYDILPDLFR